MYVKSERSERKINLSSLLRIGPIPTINKWFSIHTREWEQRGSLGLEQVINNISKYVMLVQLMERVGNFNNAVSISVNWIFDSNYNKALPLVIESLNIICYSLDGYDMFSMFETVLYSVRYVSTKARLKLAE